MNRPLTREERVSYLANVLSIAQADREVEQEEAVAIQAIAKQLNAAEADFRAARRLVRSGDFGLRFLKHPAHRMANMEDMVMVALADGEATADETKPIERLASLLHFSQTDMDMLVKRAEGKLKRIVAGREAAAAKAGKIPFDTPVQPPSTPPPLPVVQERHPPGEPPAPGEVAGETTDAPPAEPLPEPEPEDEEPALSPLAACMAQRDLSDAPSEYCFGVGGECVNPWGCRLLDMDWEPGSEWLALGRYRDDDTFVFDRDAIRAHLSAAREHVRACPYLQPGYIEAALNALPSRASVWGRWVRRRAARNKPGATRLKVREYLHGCSLTRSMVARGVDPVGMRGAIKVISRAAKACGRPVDTKLFNADEG